MNKGKKRNTNNDFRHTPEKEFDFQSSDQREFEEQHKSHVGDTETDVVNTVEVEDDGPAVAVAEEPERPDIPVAYDKAKSFFDDISMDTRKSRTTSDRKVDAETFGDIAETYKSRHSNRFRGRGRRDRGRGRYNRSEVVVEEVAVVEVGVTMLISMADASATFRVNSRTAASLVMTATTDAVTGTCVVRRAASIAHAPRRKQRTPPENGVPIARGTNGATTSLRRSRRSDSNSRKRQ